MKESNTIERRAFLKASAGALAAIVAPQTAAQRKEGDAVGGTGDMSAGEKLIVSAPMLQNAAETSVGVAWAVSAMANGFVEVSESSGMSNPRRVKCGGFRVTGMDDQVVQVRLTGLKPATRYWYRIGADRIDYRGGYAMKRIGTEKDPRTYSFKTLGPGAESRFCVINDTHERVASMNPVFDKVAELNPPSVVWNGDACNVQETMESLVSVFLRPKIRRGDYAAETPYLFCPGNHDQRGLAARRLERVMMFRQPEERVSRDWDLGRNFAVRQGDIALVGLDTGEDRPDGASVSAGLFSNGPYREAQTEWLRDALRRDDIASAPFLVCLCHIPLYSPKWNGAPIPGQAAKQAWLCRCGDIWGPLLDEAGCQVVIAGHTHRYRYDAAVPGHRWKQIVGGGPDMGRRFDRELKRQVEDAGRFPTVIEGKVEKGELVMTVHDVFHRKAAGRFRYVARKAVSALALAASLVLAEASARPAFVLPDTLYAAPGIECNVYFAQVFDAVKPTTFAFEARCGKGACLDECWRWTPVADDAGSKVRLVLNAWNDDGLAAAVTTTVCVAGAPVCPQRKVTLALLGASAVNCRFQDQLMVRMHAAGFANYTPVGSHSSGANCADGCRVVPGEAAHDGYGGFAAGDFLRRWKMTPDEFTELQSDAEREQLKSFGVKLKENEQWRRHLLKSPLMRVKDGKPVLDVRRWFERINGGMAPDAIVIVLGGNGVFGCRPDTLDDYMRNVEMANIRKLVDVLRKAAPDALIALATRFGGALCQDAYGRNYGCHQSQVQARKNIFRYNRELERFVRESADPRIVLAPVAQALDPVNGYPAAKEPAFAHAKEEVMRGRNALHPTLEGGRQLGDAYAAWLMWRLGSGGDGM